MTKFLYVYHAPPAPAELQNRSPEDMKATMDKWYAWSAQVGDGMVDFGTPAAGGVRVTPTGTAPSTLQVAGYSIVEAPDLDAALALTADHPHLAWPGGEIEVHELLAIPGL